MKYIISISKNHSSIINALAILGLSDQQELEFSSKREMLDLVEKLLDNHIDVMLCGNDSGLIIVDCIRLSSGKPPS